MKKTKILSTFALIIISILITPDIIFAEGTLGATTQDPGSIPSYPDNPATDSNGKEACSATSAGTFSKSWCDYGLSTQTKSTVFLDIYNRAGEYLGNVITINDKKVLAGTFIGIDFFEEYRKKATVTIYPRCYSITVTLTCEVEEPANCWFDCNGNFISYISNNNNQKVIAKPLASGKTGGSSGGSNNNGCQNYIGTCKKKSTKTVTSGSCPAGTVSSTPSCESNSCTPPTYESCYDGAVEKLNTATADVSPSYDAVRQDVNDANYKNNNGKNEIPVESYNVTETIGPKTEENGKIVWKEKIQNIKYNLQQTCINVKTGNIRYIEYSDKCNASTELTVEDIYNQQDPKTKIGLYFIPLNAKSNQKVVYKMAAKEKRPSKLCVNIIENYENDPYERWRVLLLDQDKKTFPANITAKKAKERVANGCYYSGIAEFEVIQKFYNENASNKLEGYGFYYRPIDVSNPFPNGLGNSTYWGKKDKNNKPIYDKENNSVTIDNETYDLDDSFKNTSLTYTADINNPNAIREYNKRADSEGRSYLYMSWDNMNVDGSSGFIDAGYVTRNGKQSYYKLGCGPSNNTWKECDG